MPRQVVLTTPPERTESVLELLHNVEGVLSLHVFRGASMRPPGDVVNVELTNKATHVVLAELEARKLLIDPRVLISTNEPTSVLAPARMEEVGSDVSDSTWEEMSGTIRRTANIHLNTVLMMVLGGALAGFGLALNALELVLAAMVVSAEFEPIAQVGLGIASRNRSELRSGLLHSGAGAAAMFVGGLLAATALHLKGYALPAGAGSYLSEGALVRYFAQTSYDRVFTDAAAATAGAILIAANRSQLTAGISMALPIVPLAALPGIALVTGDGHLAKAALLRLAMDFAFVIAAAIVVFTWKRHKRIRRNMVA